MCQKGQKFSPLLVHLHKIGRVLPKLYRTSHPKAPYRVVFTAPHGKVVRRHFKDPEKAKAYHRELLAAALSTFTDLYNCEWRLEKLRYLSPIEARRDYQSAIPLAA